MRRCENSRVITSKYQTDTNRSAFNKLAYTIGGTSVSKHNKHEHKPLRSVLISTDSGTVIPARCLPSPVPALQPILSRRTFPMPPVTGAARVNVS